MHEHDHQHQHPHDHEHGHQHDHNGHRGFESIEQATALMSYMLEHNRHHAEELHQLAHDLAAMGKESAAALLHGSLEQYAGGNDALEAALRELKGEN